MPAADPLAPFRAMLEQSADEAERAHVALLIEDILREAVGPDEDARERLRAAIREVVRKEFGQGTARIEAALRRAVRDLDR